MNFNLNKNERNPNDDTRINYQRSTAGAIPPVDTRKGDKRTIAKSIKDKDGNDRVLILESTPAIVAKSRYTLPDKMPLDGEAFFTTLWHTIHQPQ